MKKYSSASIQYDAPAIITTADAKPKKSSLRISVMKPKKNKINKKKK
jgi:hypothetical protein